MKNSKGVNDNNDNQNGWRIGKLQVLGNIGSGYNQTSGEERKKKKEKKRVPQTNEKTSGNQTQQQKSHQRDKHADSPTCKILGTILKIDEEGTQMDQRIIKFMTIPKALHPRDYMFHEKKEKEDQYEDYTKKE